MTISMDMLYVRNIPEIQDFLTQNNQDLCGFLKDLDCAEDVLQVEEGDYEERERKWSTIAFIGGAAIVGCLGVIDYKIAHSPSLHKHINETLVRSSILGLVLGIGTKVILHQKFHDSLNTRLKEKICSIKRRIENPKNGDIGEMEVQELRISKMFFEKILNTENQQHNETIKQASINAGWV